MERADFRNLSKEVQAEASQKAGYAFLSNGKEDKTKIAVSYRIKGKGTTPTLWIKNCEAREAASLKKR